MNAAIDALVAARELIAFPLPPCELDRAELRRVHEQAILIRARFPEFFPDVRRPSCCPFDARPVSKPGTLAGLMQGASA
jgi:hypothetical protein